MWKHGSHFQTLLPYVLILVQVGCDPSEKNKYYYYVLATVALNDFDPSYCGQHLRNGSRGELNYSRHSVAEQSPGEAFVDLELISGTEK